MCRRPRSWDQLIHVPLSFPLQLCELVENSVQLRPSVGDSRWRNRIHPYCKSLRWKRMFVNNTLKLREVPLKNDRFAFRSTGSSEFLGDAKRKLRMIFLKSL